MSNLTSTQRPLYNSQQVYPNNNEPSLYETVARHAIMNWYVQWDDSIPETEKEKVVDYIVNTFTPAQIEKGDADFVNLARESGFKSLENLQYGIGALDSITSGIQSLAKDLEIIELSNASREDIKNGLLMEDPQLNEILANGGKRFLDNFQGDSIDKVLYLQMSYINALEAIHDNWRENNEKKFFDPKREAKQYMHLEAEFIGFKDLKLDGLFLDGVAKETGIFNEINLKDVENEYKFRQQEMVKKCLMLGVVDYSAHDPYVSPKILEQIKSSPEIQARLLEQITDRMQDCFTHINRMSNERVNELLQKQTQEMQGLNIEGPERN